MKCLSTVLKESSYIRIHLFTVIERKFQKIQKVDFMSSFAMGVLIPSVSHRQSYNSSHLLVIFILVISHENTKIILM